MTLTTPLTLRQARPEDADAMCAIINPIIALGDTTAYGTPFTSDTMTQHYVSGDHVLSCVVAEMGQSVEGFQGLFATDPAKLPFLTDPAGIASIASFARIDTQARGIGSAMIVETMAVARAKGVRGIEATIRADNVPGLAYYSRCGFKDVAQTDNVPLSDGRVVGRVHKVLYL